MRADQHELPTPRTTLLVLTRGHLPLDGFQPAMTLASQPTQFVLIHPQERPGYFTEFHMSELLMRPAYSERIKRLSAVQR